MQILPETEAVNLSLVGAFNPAIFTPHWFSHNQLISAADAESANVEVVHRDVTVFQTNWFSFYADQERVQINPIDPVSIRVFDLTLRLFGEVLPHTPVRGIGINYMCHFRVRSIESLHAVGDALAPKEPWGFFGEETRKAAPKDAVATGRAQKGARAGGLVSMTMAQNFRDDGRPGLRQVKVEPSTRFHPALYVETNDHYSAAVGSEQGGAGLMASIEGVFDESVSWSKSVTDRIMALSEAVRG